MFIIKAKKSEVRKLIIRAMRGDVHHHIKEGMLITAQRSEEKKRAHLKFRFRWLFKILMPTQIK